MNSKLVILANQKPMALPDDFSISVEFKNPLFNDTEMFSYPVEFPIEGNRHLFKNIDDVNSDLRPISFEHTPAQIIADGVPFASGPTIVQNDAETKDSFPMNIDSSTQSFSDLIGDLQCRDIPIPAEDKKDLMIGEKIGNVHISISYKYHACVKYEGKKGDTDIYSDKNDVVESTLEPQALGFSYPATCEVIPGTQYAAKKETRDYKEYSLIVPKTVKSYINVTDEYGASTRYAGASPAKYCNARVCYKHYAKDDEGKTSSEVVQAKDSTNSYEDKSPYWVLDADRPQSGICFYVLYFLDCLFKHLEVQFDKSALLAVEDFKHLCFFTTHCEYDVEPLHGTEDKPYYTTLAGINKWLSTRGCGGQFELEDPEPKQVQSLVVDGVKKKVGQDKIASITLESTIVSKTISANVMAMYANSDNFPDESVSTILDSLENAFGIKFNYDYEQKKVTAYLIRDVFRRQPANPRLLHAEIHDIIPIGEKITGVRQRYGDEVDSKEQKQYVKDSRKNKNMGYDTDFNYIDYPKDRTIYSAHLYQQIFRNVHNGDKNVYIDTTTGNAYRVKVDGDAKTAGDLRPSLFEVGQWKGVEYGDCSKLNEDFIQDFTIDFKPITFNDVNYQRELILASGAISGTYNGKVYSITDINNEDLKPILAAYIDQDMEHEFVEQRIRNAVSSSWADFYLAEVLKLVESYDPGDTDDGNSPLQTYDWGVAIAMMRGGGVDADTQTFDYNYDSFGTSKWCTVSGKYALASDTMDNWGNLYDYNGKLSGIGKGERFSLKIRAYKQPEWSDKPLCDANVKNRGLFDTFLTDYAYFLLHRHKYRVTCSASVAQIADIPNHWKDWWLIDGKKCLINRVSTDITVKDGMGEVELEVYSL